MTDQRPTNDAPEVYAGFLSVTKVVVVLAVLVLIGMAIFLT